MCGFMLQFFLAHGKCLYRKRFVILPLRRVLKLIATVYLVRTGVLGFVKRRTTRPKHLVYPHNVHACFTFSTTPRDSSGKSSKKLDAMHLTDGRRGLDLGRTPTTNLNNGPMLFAVSDENAQEDVGIVPTYTSDDIIVLQGLDAVRKRPGMYIGNTGESGIHQLLFEVLDNSVDEYLAGACNKINVVLKCDGSVEISDNGRGIPCEISSTTNMSGLETVLTTLHSGGKFSDTAIQSQNLSDEQGQFLVSKSFKNKSKAFKNAHKDGASTPYEYSSGLHGVGLSVVNALSEWLKVQVYRAGEMYSMGLSKGQIVTPLSVSKGSKRTGTFIAFMPDYEHVFKVHHAHSKENCPGCTNAFNLETIRVRVEELSYLNPGLHFHLTDERVVNEEGGFQEYSYCHKGGTSEFLQDLIRDKTPIHRAASIINIRGKMNGVEVEIALNWSAESYTAVIKGYANNVATVAGTHIDGLKAAITKSVNLCCRKQGYFKTKGMSISGDFIREGLTAIVSVKLKGAEFDGQTKSKLGNHVARIAVEKIASSQLMEVLERHSQLLLAIYNKSQAAKKAFEAARAAKELVRTRNSNMLTSGLPAKLSDCTSRNPMESEIFIVEGESAAGNAKQARNRQFQAVLPLRGKILNVEKITNDLKVMDNEEIRLLINSLGIVVNPSRWRLDNISQIEFSNEMETENTEMQEKEFIPACRYGKIILLTDADVDGAHLRILLLGLLFRLCARLFEKGHVYTACPPLYRISQRGKKWGQTTNGDDKSKVKSAYTYAWSDEELPKLTSHDKHGDVGGKANSHANILDAMSKNICIQRFKGLGEMMAQQLWNTTMDPRTRTLNRISVADAKKASDMLWLLMGGDIQSRKEYIFNNASNFNIHDLDM